MKAYSHGGDVYSVPVRLDFSVNVHPDGVPDFVREAVIRSADRWGQYPDEQLRALRGAFRAAASRFGFSLRKEEMIFGDGSAELMYLAARRYEGKKAAVVTPCFTEYRRAFEAAGAFVEAFPLPAETPLTEEAADAVCAFLRRERPAALMLGNPVNPTGRAFLKEEVLRIAESCEETGTDLILDECFVWFTEEPFRHTVVREVFRDPERYRRVLVINAFTKIFAMPGLRFGFGLSPDTEGLKKLEALRQPWPVSVPAEAAALACVERLMRDLSLYSGKKGAGTETLRAGEGTEPGTEPGTGRTDLKAERAFLTEGLRRLGFRVIPSTVNYLLFRAEETVAGGGLQAGQPSDDGNLQAGQPADDGYLQAGQPAGGRDLRAACLEKGVLIRSCADFEGLSQGWYRTAVRKHHENEALLRVLGEVLKGKEEDGQETES